MPQSTTHNPTTEIISNNTNKLMVGIGRKNTPKRIKEPEKNTTVKNP